MRRWLRYTLLTAVLLMLLLAGCGDAQLQDGTYEMEVSLEGGSGRASVESPAVVRVEDGKIYVTLTWSSPHYDYMVVDEETYLPLQEEGNSVFEIPVSALDTPIEVQADTTAMSKPHLIDYTITVHDKTRASKSTSSESADAGFSDLPQVLSEIDGRDYLSSDENTYAKNFRIDRYEDGWIMLVTGGNRQYLLLPEGEEADAIPDGIVQLQRPVRNLYLAATSAMSQFDAIDEVDAIRMSSLEAGDWYVDSARRAMEDGQILYGGKYSAPDYEQMLEEKITLAVESGMILHVPKVQDKLEDLGIPVLIDYSSYEDDPLARAEWVKVYGVLTGKEKEAEAAFARQEAYVEDLLDEAVSDVTVTVFSMNSNHQIVMRRDSDYFSEMAEMTGATFLAPEDDGSDAATITVNMETFYAIAQDADFLIYNTAIETAPSSLEELTQEYELLSQFAAVQSHKVYCTADSLYQHAASTGEIICDLYEILSEEETENTYFYRLD